MITLFPDELDYVNAKLHPLGGTSANSFLYSFLNACLRADGDNYRLLQPILREYMTKYPPLPERLAMEQQDRA
jgi:hypothetical protein